MKNDIMKPMPHGTPAPAIRLQRRSSGFSGTLAGMSLAPSKARLPRDIPMASPCPTLCIAAAMAVAAATHANAQGWRPDAAFTQLGKGDSTEAWSAGAQWDWQSDWRFGRSLLLRGRWEVALGRWRAEIGDRDIAWAWITQLSAVPNLRLSSADSVGGWYAEAGIGPSLLLPIYRSRERRFSTKFNFQDHLSVGYVWGRRGEHDLGLRIDHYSNAGIRKPNPGVDLFSLRYAYRFGR